MHEKKVIDTMEATLLHGMSFHLLVIYFVVRQLNNTFISYKKNRMLSYWRVLNVWLEENL